MTESICLVSGVVLDGQTESTAGLNCYKPFFDVTQVLANKEVFSLSSIYCLLQIHEGSVCILRIFNNLPKFPAAK